MYHILFLIFNFLFLSSFIFPSKSLYIRPLIADQRMSLILEQNICKLRLIELEENVLSSLANSVCDPVEDRDLVLNFEISQGRIGEMMSKKEEMKGRIHFHIIYIVDINHPIPIFLLFALIYYLFF